MATILLQAAGTAVGSLIGGPVGGMVGRALGALGGAAIDRALLTPGRRREGPRLGQVRISDADEGAGIARVYGTARVAGQVIWTTRFEEAATTERQGGKGGRGGGESTTTYSYFGNLALGLCEGPIAGVRRVWADGEEIDLSEVTLRVHRGAEDQLPDPLIEARQGSGNAPAYRGLAYAVIERLPLERWGNRLPQLAFEVLRPVGELERRMRAVTIIPGASEHGLDPLPVRDRMRPGESRSMNRNMGFGESDFTASLEELTGLCPALERAALVVAWFGDDLRAGHCTVRPGVEAAARDETTAWQVGPTTRSEARLISWSGGGPAYGGTPSDAGVLRAIAAMRARGLKVTLYPFLLMDVPAGNAKPDPYGGTEQAAYPWRGRIALGPGEGTAAAAEAVARFVGTVAPMHFSIAAGRVDYSGPAEWSLRRMVLHQAFLAKLAGGVDAFVIASEMRGLTRLRGPAGSFPFVAALVSLAADVKAVLPAAKVTYAADWSEYFGFQPPDGSGNVYFNLDPLWSSPSIDMIGIDNYLPTADWQPGDADGEGPDGARSPYDLDALRRGIADGEQADWYYGSEADRAARMRRPITDGLGKPWTFRPKDLVGWWSNLHVERRNWQEVGGPTAWVPRSKPIWFTELGCPAVDGGANQPNVFFDPKSAESRLPYFSAGARDDLVQRRFLEAHLSWWDPASPGFTDAANPVSPVYGGRMVEPSAIHLWAFDARPYPAFPLRTDVWSDGPNWRRGHWLNGRLGRAPLDGLIRRLLADHGWTDVEVEADALLGGYVVAGPGSARTELEELMRLCGLVAHARDGRLTIRSMQFAGAARPAAALAEEDPDAPLLERRRSEESEVPQEVVIGHADPARAYQTGAASAALGLAGPLRQDTIELPVVLEEDEALRFAAEALATARSGRETVAFSLPPTDVATELGDVLALPGTGGRWMVTRIEGGAVLRVQARRLPAARPPSAVAVPETPVPPPAGEVSEPVVHLIDLPPEPGGTARGAARLAVYAQPFAPFAAEATVPGGLFARRAIAAVPATMGRLAAPLLPGPLALVDETNVVDVSLFRGAMYSASPEAVSAGANLCAVRSAAGTWEVLQFHAAEEVAPGRFRLTRLLRAEGGTDDAMAAGASTGAAFVLLDRGAVALDLPEADLGRALDWRIAPLGRSLDHPAVTRLQTTLGPRAMRPAAPLSLEGSFAASGALSLRWVRRAPTGEAWEQLDPAFRTGPGRFRATVEAEAGGRLVVEVDGPALSIPAADQTAAFGTLPARLGVRVAEISPRFGAGSESRTILVRPS